MKALIIKCGSHKKSESRDDSDTDGLMKGFKPWTINWFSEDVSLLICGVDKLQTHNLLFHQVSNEMILNFDMLLL